MSLEMTPQQALAIESIEGDLVVCAGAGSGKTAVLARRFAQVVSRGADADAVLAITFTRKAAGQLAQRVRRVLTAGAGGRGPDPVASVAWISTIHGFCARVLRRHAVEARVPPGFRVMDETDAALLAEDAFEVASALREVDRDVHGLIARLGAQRARSTVLTLFGRLRSMGLTPKELSVPSPPSLGGALEETLSGLRASLDGHPREPANKTQAANAAALRAAMEVLGEAAAARTGADLADAVLQVEAGCVLRRTCPTTAGAIDAARQALAVATDAARAALVRPHAEGLVKLLAEFAAEYGRLKTERGVLDQDDLQEHTERLFRERPRVAAEYAARFAAIMVDEFQDTNELQMRVLEPLRRDNLCVVGDERQAIYSFRNADIEVFRHLRAGISSTVSLDVNFRSHSEVLAFVNAVFGASDLFGGAHANLRAGRRDELGPGAEPRVEVLLADRKGWDGVTWREAEAGAIARRVVDLIAQGTPPGDVVVLMRALTGCGPYVAALESEGVAVSVAATGAFGTRPEIAELEALLAVAALPSDSESLAAVLLGDLADISAAGLLAIRDLADEFGPTWSALEAMADGEAASLGEHDSTRVRAVVEAVTALRAQAHRRGLGEALWEACGTLGVRRSLLARGPGGERAWANVRKLIRMAETFESHHACDPGAFVEHLRARRVHGRDGHASPGHADSVRLMTVHSAKGLEFPVVVVADLGRDTRCPDDPVFVEAAGGGEGPAWAMTVPASRTGEPELRPAEYRRMREAAFERALAEEKRLLYVACTRAQERLVLSGATSLDAEERQTRPVAWVRAALGLRESAGEPGVRASGDARYVLSTIRPGESTGARSATVTPKAAEKDDTGECGAAETRSLNEALTGTPAEPGEAMLVDGPAELSYTALHLYERCAYRFYAERVIGVGAGAARSQALAFGSAVHAALRAGNGGRVAHERLTAIARAHGLPLTEVARLSAAVDAFVAAPLAARVRAAERCAHELPFAIPLADGLLSGSMDLVARNGDLALVVDYKTGTSHGDGERDAGHRLQAECYALALLESGCEAVEVAFIELERGAAVTVLPFDRQAAAILRRRLEALASAARTGPYPRLQAFERSVCGDCPVAGGLCGVTAPPRKARGAA